MLELLKSSKEALRSFEDAIQVHVNNLNNETTEGYKAMKYTFKSIFNEVSQRGYGAENDRGGKNPIQFGGTSTIAEIRNDFTQGDLISGADLDVGISGRGLFVLRSTNSNEFVYSRNGRFRVSASGTNLVDSSNRIAYGYKMNNGVADTSQLVPIELGDTETDLGWSDSGILKEGFTAEQEAIDYNTNNPTTPIEVPTATELYQIAIADFPNPEGLGRVDGTAFSESVASGYVRSVGIADSAGLGSVRGQYYEDSNVFQSGETIDSVEIQRAMGASMAALQLVNRQLQEAISTIAS